MNKRTARAHEMNVGFVQSRSFIRHQTRANIDACFTQMSKAASRNLRIRIFDGRHDAFDSRLDQCLSARRCAAMMCVWFERDISRCAWRATAGFFQRDCLGVSYLSVEIEAFTDDFAALVNYDGSHERARANLTDAARGKFQCTLHHF